MNNLDLEKNYPRIRLRMLFLNKVLSSLDKKYSVGGLFCDLHKAFDCVNHNILLNKIKLYGITGIA